MKFSITAIKSSPAVLLALLWVILPAQLAATQSLEDQLNAQYSKKLLFLRHSFASSSQEYDAHGKLRGKSDEGPWPAYGVLRVGKITLEKSTLRVEGDRVAYKFDKEATRIEPNFGSEPIVVTIHMDSEPSSLDQALAALGRVAGVTEQDGLALVPDRWKPYLGLSGAEDFCAAPAGPQEKILPPGGNITAPRVHLAPAPRFQAIKKFEGTVGLNAVINPQGHACQLHLVHPSGRGLDEEAIFAVRSWQFIPGTRGGKPVAVAMYIEIDFQLGIEKGN